MKGVDNFIDIALKQGGFGLRVPAFSMSGVIRVGMLSSQMKMMTGVIPIDGLDTIEKVLLGQVPNPSCSIAN